MWDCCDDSLGTMTFMRFFGWKRAEMPLLVPKSSALSGHERSFLGGATLCGAVTYFFRERRLRALQSIAPLRSMESENVKRVDTNRSHEPERFVWSSAFRRFRSAKAGPTCGLMGSKSSKRLNANRDHEPTPTPPRRGEAQGELKQRFDRSAFSLDSYGCQTLRVLPQGQKSPVTSSNSSVRFFSSSIPQ